MKETYSICCERGFVLALIVDVVSEYFACTDEDSVRKILSKSNSKSWLMRVDMMFDEKYKIEVQVVVLSRIFQARSRLFLY